MIAAIVLVLLLISLARAMTRRDWMRVGIISALVVIGTMMVMPIRSHTGAVAYPVGISPNANPRLPATSQVANTIGSLVVVLVVVGVVLAVIYGLRHRKASV